MTGTDGQDNPMSEELSKAYGPDWETRLGRTYLEMCAEVPPHVRERWAVIARAGHPQVIEAVEALREELIARNPLRDWRVQQLVQFGQLLVLGHEGPARLHAWAAISHGATLDDILGVVVTAYVTAGVAAFSLGVRIIGELEAAGSHRPQ
jgi:4-carboxymuconolactone decarboxylase